MENLFEANLQRIPSNAEEPFNPVQDSGSDDEDDKIIKRSKMESEYAKRFIDFGESGNEN